MPLPRAFLCRRAMVPLPGAFLCRRALMESGVASSGTLMPPQGVARGGLGGRDGRRLVGDAPDEPCLSPREAIYDSNELILPLSATFLCITGGSRRGKTSLRKGCAFWAWMMMPSSSGDGLDGVVRRRGRSGVPDEPCLSPRVKRSTNSNERTDDEN